jgi:hypothetical protein
MSETTRNWRRTAFNRLDGSVEAAPEDWSLLDDAGQPLARIYRYAFVPNAGRWSWFVLVAPDGTPANGGTGSAATGTEAREAVERLVPAEVQEKRPRV